MGSDRDHHGSPLSPMALSLIQPYPSDHFIIPPPDHTQATKYAKDVVDRGRFSLDELRQQKDSFEEQLESSQLALKLEQAHSSLRNHQQSIALLTEAQSSLATSLKQLEAASRPPSLLQDLEVLQAKLVELQRVRDYVAIIHHGLQLSENSVRSVEGCLRTTRPTPLGAATMEGFSRLQTFIASIRNLLNPIRSEGGLAILPFLDELQQRTWDRLRALLSERLLEAAGKIKWPSSVPYDSLPPPDRVNFEVSFLNLLRFQEHGLTFRTGTSTDPLYPLMTLIQPIAQRFNFHFETSRPTNRVDKPEWFFTHILNVVHEHEEFMEGVVKYLVEKTRFKGVRPLDEFTRLLLPLPRQKLRTLSYTFINSTPPRLGLLANAVGHALIFDQKLLEGGFDVEGTTLGKARIAKSELDKWGVAWEVLGRDDVFGVWVEGERKFEDEEYLSIISAPDAWALTPSDEKSHHHSSKELMTTSSNRLSSLLKSTISGTFFTYLPQSHQLVFLTKVILPLVDAYQDRIKSSLDAFDTLSGIFGRAIPGHMGDVRNLTSHSLGSAGAGSELTSGPEGVSKLVKAWVSARYVQRLIKRWKDELVWIELWDYVKERRGMVSSDLGYLELVPEEEEDESIFEVVVRKYERLWRRAEEMIVKQVVAEVGAELKEYFAGHYAKESSSWDQNDDAGEAVKSKLLSEDSNRSRLLLPALKRLTTHLTALPPPLLLHSYKPIAHQLTRVFLTQSPLLYRHRRTSFEAGSRIKRDIEFFIRVVKEGVGNVRGCGRVWGLLEELGSVVGIGDEEVCVAEEVVVDGLSSGWGKGEDEWRKELRERVGIRVDVTEREVVRGLLRCRDVTSY